MKIVIEVTGWPAMTAEEVSARRTELEARLADAMAAAERELNATAELTGVRAIGLAGERIGSWYVVRRPADTLALVDYPAAAPENRSLSELRARLAILPEVVAEVQRRLIAAAM